MSGDSAAMRRRGPYGICATPGGEVWWCSYVDEHDKVWASDFGGNITWRFEPESEKFQAFASPREAANVRQILGRPGEVWLPESGTEHISVIRTA